MSNETYKRKSGGVRSVTLKQFGAYRCQILAEITADRLCNMCSQMRPSKQLSNLILSLIEDADCKKFSFC